MQDLIKHLNQNSDQVNDLSSMSELYDRYAPAIYGRILTVVKQKDIADKILEKIFINAFVEKNIKTPGHLTFFTSVINHSRSKSYSIMKAIKIFRECNCSLQAS